MVLPLKHLLSWLAFNLRLQRSRVQDLPLQIISLCFDEIELQRIVGQKTLRRFVRLFFLFLLRVSKNHNCNSNKRQLVSDTTDLAISIYESAKSNTYFSRIQIISKAHIMAEMIPGLCRSYLVMWAKGRVTIKTRGGCGEGWDLSRQVNIHMECCNSFISLFTTKHTFCLTPKQAQCWFTAKSEIDTLISPGCYVHSTLQSEH